VEAGRGTAFRAPATLLLVLRWKGDGAQVGNLLRRRARRRAPTGKFDEQTWRVDSDLGVGYQGVEI